MTSDDQQFLDTLASLSSQIRQALAKTPETINWSIDEASGKVRSALESATWVPDFARPRPPPPPRTFVFPSKGRGVFDGIAHWLNEHRAFVAAVAAFLGTGTLLYVRRRKAYARKRRAKKSKTGARCEVVVVAGSPSTPAARSVILDLERRGFIVYVVTSGPLEEEDVKAEQKPDILPLHLDVTSAHDVEDTMAQFQHLLRAPQHTFPGSEAHQLSLAGLIIIPDIGYPAGPVETISAESWSDELNAKLLRSITTTQAFLRTLCEFQSRLLVLTPSIVSSLKPPFQSVETTIVSALEGFTQSLQSELATVGVDVCLLRLGNFDSSPVATQGALAHDTEQEVLLWPSFARPLYAQNYLTGRATFYGNKAPGHKVSRDRRAHGSHLRQLNNAVFDTLCKPRPWSVQRVGQGSFAYALVGALTPPALVRRMMGIRSVSEVPRARTLSESSQWEKINDDRSR